MTQIIADRFVESGVEWLDLATGAHARLRIAPAGSMASQLGWSARCAALANLRHPLLNTLLDYGVLDQSRTFEAYRVDQPIAVDRACAEALLTHAVRFLEAHGVTLNQELADAALRPMPRGPAASSTTQHRFVGVVLQRRAAFDALTDALEALEPPGASVVRIVGTSQMGLRTLRLLTARAARLHGYVPVDASVLLREQGGLPRLADRHVCVLADDGQSGAVSAVLPQLGSEGGRRHLVLSFTRTRGSAQAVPLEPMPLPALVATVFVERDFGPSAEEILDAARGAGGRPGLLLARLRGLALDAASSRPVLVRETAPAYELPVGTAGIGPAGHRPRRTAAVLLRAATRAQELARAGRHAAAERLLGRAIRQLSARGDRIGAARCALGAGAIAMDRGRTALAIRAFEQARDLAPCTRLSVEASIGIGGAWLDDGRLIDGEAAMRTALLAATELGDSALAESATAGLAECLRVQGRAAEAAVLPLLRTEPGSSIPLAAAATRVHLALGNIPSAVRTARHAVGLSARSLDPRARTNAHRALSEALTAAGDAGAARAQIAEGLETARHSHLPLESLRLRLAEIPTLRDEPARARGRAHQLEAMARHGVPRLLLAQIESACAVIGRHPVASDACSDLKTAGAVGFEHPYTEPRGAVAELEILIELSHTAPSDAVALERVCAGLRDRLRALSIVVMASGAEERVLALAGRPWPGEPEIARRVLASGLGVPPDRLAEPAQAAEPVRYGGEVVAVIAARWSAGSGIDADRACALLRVGALALAASVRAMLDRADPRDPRPRPDDIMGSSAPVRGLRDAIARAARAPFPVLIEGESGSGKELVARAIHRLGPRRDRRFCPLNCAALTDELLEAELFGHARGAFTGAVGERPGLFEEADGGTIFLDEIGELSARAQAKLLRVLQDGEVRRVGENVSRRVDVRVVAATNRRLAEEAAAGRFRADLRFRLDVVRLEIPPLRERSGDVPQLAAHFWADAASRVGSQATLAPETVAALARYDWPGNVRELQNVMAWMAVHSPRRGRVGASALPAHVAQSATPSSGTFEAAREEFERRFVRAALAAASGRRASAASAIGVSRQGLAKMMRRLGIDGT